MKFLALNPKDFYLGWPLQGDFFRERFPVPALTFPILSRLLPPGHEMRFLDGFFEPVPMKRYLELVRWADVVGFNITSNYAAINYAVTIRQIKRLNPRAFIIAGGHHTNMFPVRWLELGVDIIVRGEAELMFTQLMEEIAGRRQFDRVPGVMFMKDGEIIETPPPPQLKTLDESPHPNWDLINFKHYLINLDRRKEYTAPLETSRGCTFKCKFCAVPAYWKGTQRYKSTGRVIEEVKELIVRNIKQLCIIDDGFGNDIDRTYELMDAFRKIPDMPYWFSFLRLDTVLNDPDLIDRLAEGGMRVAMIGFESLNEEVLANRLGKGMREGLTLKDGQEIYKRFRRNKIMVSGLFMSGYPGVEKDLGTSYYDARTICDDPHTVDYMPFPGTFGFDEINQKYSIKDMFFHDVKLSIFQDNDSGSFMFNLLNLIDVLRGLRMLTGPAHYRANYFVVYRRLLARALRVNRFKIRDYLLMRRKDLTSDQKQEQLFRWYLEDPKYQNWLDNLTDKVRF